MKTALTVLSFLMGMFVANAQDILKTKSGEAVEVKVIEINPDNIKYKKQSNIDGPLYTIKKNEVTEIIFENGEREIFSAKTTEDPDGRKTVFVQTTKDSDAHPDHELWKAEIERNPNLRVGKNQDEADLIFEFRIRRAMGEARVSVTVYDQNNKELWKSKRYRGTANVFNRMSPSFHGIRKCLDKGIGREMEKGTF